MAKTGYNRSLGSSKREQGILTPPAPHQLRCGCLYRAKELMQMCQVHTDGMQKIMQQLQDIAQQRKPETPADILKQQTEKGTPWVENVKTAEAISVGIVTPGEEK